MKPEEWVSSTLKRWDSGHLYEGAQHLAAALEEIARLQAQLAQAERVVVPECGYRFNTHCLCAIPSSRVLKDGEVAVDAELVEEIIGHHETRKVLLKDCPEGLGTKDADPYEAMQLSRELACHEDKLFEALDALCAQGKEGAT